MKYKAKAAFEIDLNKVKKIAMKHITQCQNTKSSTIQEKPTPTKQGQ